MPLKNPRVGECPLERVVLSAERRLELLERTRERFEAARVVLAQGVVAVEQVERGAALRTGLGEHQGTVGEVEGRERDLTR